MSGNVPVVDAMAPPTTQGGPREGRAVVLTGPRTVELRSLEIPAPAPDEVVVRVSGCGICGSDLPSWQGRPWLQYPLPPGSPGHEAWGVVEAVGARVRDLRPGDPVAGLIRNGFQERAVTPRTRLVRIPPDVAGMQPQLPFEPLACAVNAFRRSGVGRGDRVAVVGVGYIGAALVALAAGAGAHVFAVSRDAEALRLAKRLGAEWTVAAGDYRPDTQDRLVRALDMWSGGVMADQVFEVTGHQAPLDLATRLCRTRGRLLIAGYHQDGPRTVDMQTWNWRGLDVVNAHEREDQAYLDGMRIAFDRIRDGTFAAMRPAVRTYAFPDLARAFTAYESRSDGGLKSVVAFAGEEGP